MLSVLRWDLLVRRLLPQIIQLEIAISLPAATHDHNQHFLSDCYYKSFAWYMSFSLLTRRPKHYKCTTDKSSVTRVKCYMRTLHSLYALFGKIASTWKSYKSHGRHAIIEKMCFLFIIFPWIVENAYVPYYFLFQTIFYNEYKLCMLDALSLKS